MNGWDSLTLYGLLAGAPASVWGAANFIPELAAALFDAASRRRDLDEACRIWARIWPICNVLETSGSYAAAVKIGCELIGEPVGPPRKPILRLDDAFRARLRAALDAANVKEV